MAPSGAATPIGPGDPALALAAALRARPRVALTEEERREVACCTLRLSLSAQFSKSADLARDARKVLETVAHIVRSFSAHFFYGIYMV